MNVLSAFPNGLLALLISTGVVFLLMFLVIATRFKKCPSDKILVVYGKMKDGVGSKCIHGARFL